MSDNKIISIGWDVGGWLGKKNAISALKYDNGNFEWICQPKTFEIKEPPFSLNEFIKLVGIEAIHPDYKYIIAIDAPLGFPSAYVDFIKNLEVGSIYKSAIKQKEIDNLFAYRETERIINKQFNKKPLSATFDKLGNNAIVAMTHLKTWGDEIIIHPQDIRDSEKMKIDIIEVYPGILKEVENNNKKYFFENHLKQIESLLIKMSNNSEILNAFEYYKSKTKTDIVKTDELDACICAILGMAFQKPINDLFKLKSPEIVTEVIAKEGWIYYPE